MSRPRVGGEPVGRDRAAAILVGLPGITPPRLRRLLARWPDPVEALAAVRAGRATGTIPLHPASRFDEAARAELATRWREAAASERVGVLLERRGTGVLLAGDPDYPIDCVEIPDHPAILLVEGSHRAALDAPRVAIVGTRAATPHGVDDARALGAELAAAGVTVVSGLALGVDAAAHEGALDAGGGVIGVVATGLDVEYPRRHRALYARVRARGLIVGESGFGVRPAPARFPVRNRIIAALADITVVIEATARGGARITAEHALRYGRPVFANPGSRRNPAAVGCNELIADGAHPLLDPTDVLVGLGLTPGSRRRGACRPERPPPAGEAARLWQAFGGEPATPDQLANRSGLPLPAVAEALCVLAREGWARPVEGRWWPA